MKWDEKLVLGSAIIATGAILLTLTWNIATIEAIGDVMKWQSMKNGKPDADLVDLTSIAQINTANYTLAQVFLSGLSLIISIGGFVFLYISLNQTKKSLMDNERFGEAQTSCYVHAKDARFGEKGNIILIVENTGITPVKTFRISCDVKFPNDDEIISSIEFNNKKLKVWSSLAGGASYECALDPENMDLIDLRTNPNMVYQLAASNIFNWNILVYGTIYYQNIHNKIYKTQFAFFVKQTSKNKFRKPTRELLVHELVKGGMPSEEG